MLDSESGNGNAALRALMRPSRPCALPDTLPHLLQERSDALKQVRRRTGTRTDVGGRAAGEMVVADASSRVGHDHLREGYVEMGVRRSA